MSLLSTLRPLPQRLLERLWLILSGYVPISIEYQMTLGALNDDCLLILLDTLSMSQLLQLRGVSRRLCYLIEGQCLPKFKTLFFTYEKKKKTTYGLTGGGTIQLYFASRKDVDREFDLSRDFFSQWIEHFFPESMLVPLRSHAWPLSLPLLLPRLSSLTLEHFLVDQIEAPTKVQLAVNRRFESYLNSNWSTTLTTLHLYIYVPRRPKRDNASFAKLNQLSNLKHLLIDFLKLPKPENSSFLLPDFMPVLGQLMSFALRNYGGSNAATLLHQLGPALSYLSLSNVNCSEDDCIAFLRDRPNYAQTLKTFGVCLKIMSRKLFTMATENLSSLEAFSFYPRETSENRYPFIHTDLESILTDLSHFPHLKIVSVPLSLDKLRPFHRLQPMPDTLPRLTSIRCANISIHNLVNPIQPSVLFDQLLPLLSRVFCRLDNLTIRISFGWRKDKALSKQLSTKVRQLFPALEHLEASYFVEW